MTTTADNLDDLLTSVVNLEYDYPELRDMPWFQPLYDALVNVIVELMTAEAMAEERPVAEMARIDRPFAEGVFLLDLQTLLHHPSEN